MPSGSWRSWRWSQRRLSVPGSGSSAAGHHASRPGHEPTDTTTDLRPAAAGSAVMFTLAWILAPATQRDYQPVRDDLSAWRRSTAAHRLLDRRDTGLADPAAALARPVDR